MNKAFLIASDKIGKKLLSLMPIDFYENVIIDKSVDIKKIWRLILKRRIPINAFAQIFKAELFRENPHIDVSQKKFITNNKELLQILKSKNIKKLYLFRAGLVISKEILDQGIDIMNVHCADIPEYGGLGAIYRAIKNKRYIQHAVLYKITERIDDGEIISKKNYILNPDLSYLENENIAYNAGIELFLKEINKNFL